MCRAPSAPGWNPYYKNEKRTVESYLCHEFEQDFYGADMRLLVCACIRPQADFSSMDDLIKAIQADVDFGQETGFMFQQSGSLLPVPVRIRAPNGQRLINFQQVVLTFFHVVSK